MHISHLHHIAFICSDYHVSKQFYTEVLGFEVIQEIYRAERQSYKCDLALNGQYLLELFSFPNPPKRPSYPEAAGLRHLAFAVDQLEPWVVHLNQHGITTQAIRTDEHTGKRFFFFNDPDNLPIELYEQQLTVK